MPLNYDFDIFEVIPSEMVADPELGDFLSDVGFTADEKDNRIALFRDPRTADALRDAHPLLRDFFLASGFGLNTFHSGAPRKRYPARDEGARLAVIHQLTQNAETMQLPNADDDAGQGDAFRLTEFLMQLTEAQPLPDVLDAHPNLRSPNDTITPRLPPTFDTGPQMLAEASSHGAAAPAKKIWHNRFFLLSFALGVMAILLQLSSQAGLPLLASL